MSSRFASLPHRRAIIDRRSLAEALAAIEGSDRAKLRQAATKLLKAALNDGRAEIEQRLIAHPSRGLEIAASQAFLIDQILRLLYDFTTQRLYPLSNPTAAERLTLIAVGGYGRGEMAPYSDVDIAFLTPWKETPWHEQVVETMLYALWDLGLKVGQSIRSIDEMVRQAKCDVTIRTALLEARYVWGDQDLYDEAARRFKAEVQSDTARTFIAEKLAERDARHKRMGDTRYVVEPNVKEGKGGLRDLHALFWIGKYAYNVQAAAELVDTGLFSRAEYARFHRADNFLWAVRCHLHAVAQPRRGPADLRPAARGRRADALRRPAGQIQGRAVHALLLPAGESGRRPDGRVPRASRRAVRGARTAIRPADAAAAAVEAQRVRARPRAAGAAATTSSWQRSRHG